MRLPSILARRPPLPVAAGERLLAWARLRDRGDQAGAPGWVGGTRDALYVPRRIPWEQVARADWDQDASVLRVVEVAPFGDPSPVHLLGLDDAGRLLQLVRERVSASIVVQRHVRVTGSRSVRILARRAPGGHGEPAWFVEYDEGLAPDDPRVDAVVQGALAAARADLGG